jgi:hypothetical protein
LIRSVAKYFSARRTTHSVKGSCALQGKVLCWNHETTNADFRCYIRAEPATGDPAFGGVPLRSPLARRLVSSTRHDLSGGGEAAGIGVQELAVHLLGSSAGVQSATGNLSDYRRRMALTFRIIVMGGNRVET